MALFRKKDVGGGSFGGENVGTRSCRARHFVRNAALVRNLEKALLPIPQADEAVHLVVHGNVNAFTFVLFFAEHCAPIECLAVAVYRLGKQVIQTLMQIVDKGDIKECKFVINDNIQRLKPETFSLLVSESARREAVSLGMVDNHAKVICMKTKNDWFVVEGSGNWSDNARIEQYVVTNNKAVYDFHLTWLNRSLASRWT